MANEGGVLWATVFTEIIANAFRRKMGINLNTGLPLLCGKKWGILSNVCMPAMWHSFKG
jgi:hypothetical protein